MSRAMTLNLFFPLVLFFDWAGILWPSGNVKTCALGPPRQQQCNGHCPSDSADDDDEVMLNVLRCQLTY